MRHKHSIRGGNPNAATSVRDAYGFEVLAMLAICSCWPAQSCVRSRLLGTLAQVKKDMHSLYHKYAPIWQKEEVERSERWDAFLAHFETMYQKTAPDQ